MMQQCFRQTTASKFQQKKAQETSGVRLQQFLLEVLDDDSDVDDRDAWQELDPADEVWLESLTDGFSHQDSELLFAAGGSPLVTERVNREVSDQVLAGLSSDPSHLEWFLVRHSVFDPILRSLLEERLQRVENASEREDVEGRLFFIRRREPGYHAALHAYRRYRLGVAVKAVESVDAPAVTQHAGVGVNAAESELAKPAKAPTKSSTAARRSRSKK